MESRMVPPARHHKRCAPGRKTRKTSPNAWTYARRAYGSLVSSTPKRKIAMIWNLYRFQSKLLEAFKEMLRQNKA
jgi:hypothetical protein